MSGLLVLDRRQTAAALRPDAVLDAVGRALVSVARDEVSVPPRIAALTPTGLLGAMPGYVPGLGLAAKLVTVTADPRHPGRGFHRGLVALFDEHDGRALALVDGESLTEVRTAAVATRSALALAVRRGLGRVAVVGTGAQARAQLTLLATVCPEAEVTVAGRDPARAREVAALYPGARVAADVEEAVRGADVVFCCTGATSPVVRREWLGPGVHVSSVGGSRGPELDPDTVRDAVLFAEWTGAATEPPPAGAHELQDLAPGRPVTLLGSVLDGTHPGRDGDTDALTVFKSTGHAALDVAAVRIAYDVALERGWGVHVDL
ncbi:ornithine cyclodeaminase family protein [Streptomyces sp. NPDC087856]|uniref:ornithine cyclodeaminase family protein n=1 Tax=Streptomyces sp. NPDC087856 TaxID=3365811 RepID=UPI00382659D7